MNRMEFFRDVILGGAGLFFLQGSADALTNNKQKISVANVYVTGFQYYDGPEVADMLETGLMLRLYREPHNHFDSSAVEVYAGEAKLGYIPRNENQTIAGLMDNGIRLKACITELDPESFPYGSVKMEIWYNREPDVN
jgi:hypothetical protein